MKNGLLLFLTLFVLYTTLVWLVLDKGTIEHAIWFFAGSSYFSTVGLLLLLLKPLLFKPLQK